MGMSTGDQRRFMASVTREGALYVAQCLEVDVASQGTSIEDAVANLREALELYFEDTPPPSPSKPPPVIAHVDVTLGG